MKNLLLLFRKTFIIKTFIIIFSILLFPSFIKAGINGDASGDGKVDGLDYYTWLKNYNTNLAGPNNGDFNNDNKVDISDYILWFIEYPSDIRDKIAKNSAKWYAGGMVRWYPETSQFWFSRSIQPWVLNFRANITDWTDYRNQLKDIKMNAPGIPILAYTGTTYTIIFREGLTRNVWAWLHSFLFEDTQ